MREVEVPPRRYAAVRWAMDEWVAGHRDDVLAAVVAGSLLMALASYLAAY